MALTREKLLKELTDAGLLSADEATKIESESESTGVEAFLSQLVESGKITKYQADKFVKGNGSEIAFGDYVVIDELGRGGMGTVLRARHRRMEREVAIKVLPTTALDSETAVARFYQEVKVAAQLTHPNIVHAYDAGEHQGFHYLVMEYVRGNDLAKVTSKEGAMELARAVDFTIQAATGLSYAHKKGVVHRDIKPSNLLLDDDNTLKILDMGLARIGRSGLEDNAESMHLTTTGQVMGTVEYMAPEQAEDTRNADHRSDIYALGCTLYRLLAGSPPFSRETVVKTILAHREEAIPSIGKGGGVIYQKLDEIFQRMVAKRPEQRYQDCETLIADLSQIKQLAEGAREEQTIQLSSSPVIPKTAPPVVSPSDPAVQGSQPQQALHGSDPGTGPNFDRPTIPATNKIQPQSPSSHPQVHPEFPSGNSMDVVDQIYGVKPDKAGVLLVIGIFSLLLSACCVGWIPGIIVWVLARSDLKAIDAGEMDNRRRSTVLAAMICGIVSVVIGALFLLFELISNFR